MLSHKILASLKCYQAFRKGIDRLSDVLDGSLQEVTVAFCQPILLSLPRDRLFTKPSLETLTQTFKFRKS